MTTASLLVLLFVIVPGFLADSILRSVFGEKRLTDFERTVRSLIFSVIGLFVYAVLPRVADRLVEVITSGRISLVPDDFVLPSYLGALLDSTDGRLTLGWTAFAAFGTHIALTIGIALLWGWFMSWHVVRERFEAATGRSISYTAWEILWLRLFRRRPEVGTEAGPEQSWITVQLVSGLRLMGLLQAATDSIDEEKDVVLGHPWFWDSEKGDWRAENIRYIYLPASRIEFISLGPIAGEEEKSGYYKDFQPLGKEGSDVKRSEESGQARNAGPEQEAGNQ
jgi:hypothetical protein